MDSHPFLDVPAAGKAAPQASNRQDRAPSSRRASRCSLTRGVRPAAPWRRSSGERRGATASPRVNVGASIASPYIGSDSVRASGEGETCGLAVWPLMAHRQLRRVAGPRPHQRQKPLGRLRFAGARPLEEDRDVGSHGGRVTEGVRGGKSGGRDLLSADECRANQVSAACAMHVRAVTNRR